jgi:hypothetical protein
MWLVDTRVKVESDTGIPYNRSHVRASGEHPAAVRRMPLTSRHRCGPETSSARLRLLKKKENGSTQKRRRKTTGVKEISENEDGEREFWEVWRWEDEQSVK